MPPRWPRKPDRKDPEFRRLEDIINFAVHVAAALAVNSGLWFVETIKQVHWSWLIWVSGIWGGVLICHCLYVFAIADYSPVNSND